MGVISANEIRARNGMAPVPGGDAYFIPMNTAPMQTMAGASIQELKGVKGPSVEVDGQTVPVDGLSSPETGQGEADDGSGTDSPPKPGDATTGTPDALAAPGPVASGDATIQDTALNGAQIESLLGVIEQVAAGTIPASTAKAILGAAFPAISPQSIDAMIDPIPPAKSIGPSPAEPPPVDPALNDSARDLIADVARRAATRLSGAARRALKKSDLGEILPALDALLIGEPATLAAMFGPACRFVATATRRAVDSADVAGRIAARCRADILACVEADDTIASLGRSIDGWDQSIPQLTADLFT